MADIYHISLFVIVGFLLLLSGFFSGSETGLTAASRAKIHKLKTEGNKRALLVSNLRKDKDRLLGAILLGNNVVNIAASAIATVLAINYFGDEGVFYATIIMTLLILIFSEVLPKTYAFRNAERVALAVSMPIYAIVRVLSPITSAIYSIVGFMLKFSNASKDGDISGAEALRGAIEMHHSEGSVVKDNRDMLGGILDLSEIEVDEIMVHRKNMEAIDIAEEVEDIISQIMDSSHTRIPIYKGRPDNIIGILHAKSLLKAVKKSEKSLNRKDIENLLAEPWFIPESTSLLHQLQSFRKKKHHFALVVDEYGELMGMITLEDILEEIVGQIEDEYDKESSGIVKQKDGSYIVDGVVTVRDINRALDWKLPDEEASTVAGLLMHDAQCIPEKGQNFHFHNVRFTVLKRKRNQIISLKMKRFDG